MRQFQQRDPHENIGGEASIKPRKIEIGEYEPYILYLNFLIWQDEVQIRYKNIVLYLSKKKIF